MKQVNRESSQLAPQKDGFGTRGGPADLMHQGQLEKRHFRQEGNASPCRASSPQGRLSDSRELRATWSETDSKRQQ